MTADDALTPDDADDVVREVTADVAKETKGFLYDLCDTVDRAASDAAQKARSAAEDAGPKFKETVNKGAYTASYGATYATVFGALCAKSLLTQNVVADGVRDGFSAAKQAYAERRAETETPAQPETTQD